MRDRLSIGRHFVVLIVGQIDVARIQRSEQVLDPAYVLVCRSVLDHDLNAGGAGGQPPCSSL